MSEPGWSPARLWDLRAGPSLRSAWLDPHRADLKLGPARLVAKPGTKVILSRLMDEINSVFSYGKERTAHKYDLSQILLFTGDRFWQVNQGCEFNQMKWTICKR